MSSKQPNLCQRVTPSQDRKAAEVTVGGNPFAARLNCQRCQISIRDEVALGPCFRAKPLENFPVPNPRNQNYAILSAAQICDKAHRSFQRSRATENLRVSHDSKE